MSPHNHPSHDCHHDSGHDHPTDPKQHGSEDARQIVAVEAAEVGYHGRAILPPISICLHEGELWALVGRNGAGKSTLMRSLLGLQPLIGGAVTLGDNVRVGYVPQRTEHDMSVPGRVRDFVEGGLDVGWSFARPWLTASQRDTVTRALAEVQLEPFANRPLHALSQGERQRAHIARALTTNPQLLVLDEPTSAMDPINERAVFELLCSIATDRGIAMLLSSHHMSFLPEHADHALLIDRDLGIATGGDLRTVFWGEDFRRVYGDLHFGLPTEDGCAH